MPMPRVARRSLLLAAAAVAVGVACTAPGPGGDPGPRSPDPGAPEAAVPPPPPTAAEVEATREELDRRAARVPPTVVAWGVDPAAGRVVVSVSGARTPEVDRFLEGLDPRTLRVDTGAAAPRPLPGG